MGCQVLTRYSAMIDRGAGATNAVEERMGQRCRDELTYKYLIIKMNLLQNLKEIFTCPAAALGADIRTLIVQEIRGGFAPEDDRNQWGWIVQNDMNFLRRCSDTDLAEMWRDIIIGSGTATRQRAEATTTDFAELQTKECSKPGCSNKEKYLNQFKACASCQRVQCKSVWVSFSLDCWCCKGERCIIWFFSSRSGVQMYAQVTICRLFFWQCRLLESVSEAALEKW